MTKTGHHDENFHSTECFSDCRVLTEDELAQVSGGLPPLVLAGVVFGIGAAAIHTWFFFNYQLK